MIKDKYIALGRFLSGSSISGPTNATTENPRNAKNVMATLEMIERRLDSRLARATNSRHFAA